MNAPVVALAQLRRRVDRHFEDAFIRERPAMICARQCETCCHVRLSVFTIEADRIRQALSRLHQNDPQRRQTVRRQADDPSHADKCPMLIDGLCAIYDDRPLICRSHGLPLWSREDEQVFHCALNFRDGQPDRRSVLDLEALNRPLAAMAELYDPSGSRTPLTELARDLETTGTSAK